MIEYSLHMPVPGGKPIEYVTTNRVAFDSFRDRIVARFPNSRIHIFVRTMPEPPPKPLVFRR